MTTLLSQLIELNAKTERILEFRHNPFGRSEKEMDQQDEQGKKYGGKGLAIAVASGLGAYGIKKAHDLGKIITEGKGGMAENVFTGLVAAPQIAATRVSEKVKSIKKGLRKLGRKMAMSSNHERLVNLNAKVDDLLEFGLASGGTTAAARNAIWAAERKAGVPRGKMSFFRKRDSKEVSRRKATSLPREVWPKEMQPYLDESADRDLGLFSALDTNLIELGRYDEDYGDRRMLSDAALGVGTLGTGIGLLYARNRGDKINKAKYAAGIGKAKALTAGQFGPAIPTAEQYAGGTRRAIGTGIKDIYKSIMSKISIPALARNIKASARLERLVNLNAKTDSLVQFDDYDMIGAGLIGGSGLYCGSYLNNRGAGIKVNKREAKNYAMNNIPMDTPEPEIKKRLAAYVEKPGLMRNMRVGASDALKSLSKKIR